MDRGKPIPIRLTEDLVARLDKVSERMHLFNRSAVIKFCVSTFLDYFEKHGEASLPSNWQAILQDMDHRYSRVEKKEETVPDGKPDIEKKKKGSGK